jgi:hypothetical protein
MDLPDLSKRREYVSRDEWKRTSRSVDSLSLESALPRGLFKEAQRLAAEKEQDEKTKAFIAQLQCTKAAQKKKASENEASEATTEAVSG